MKWRGVIWALPPTLIVAFLSWQWRNIQLDDALIYLRYVRNLLAGQGLTYNPGESFNGLTSPLFTWVLAGFAAVLGNPQAASILISAIGLLAAALLGGRLFARSDSEAAIIASLIAGSSYFYTTFGMETTCSLALIAATLLAARKGSDWVFPIAALAVAMRIEVALLVLPVVVHYLYRAKKLPPARYLIAAVAIFAIPFIINALSYGHPLPDTAAAKFGQGASGYWGKSWAFLKIGYLLNWAFDGSIATVVFLGAMAAVGGFLLRKDASARVSLVYLGLLASFYLITNMPNYHWYYAPFIYLLMLYAGTGIARTLTFSIEQVKERRYQWAFVAAVVIAGTVLAATNVVSVTGQTRHEPYARIGQWLKQNTPADASVAAAEIGTIGWYSERPVVDILGLVNPGNASYIAKRDVYSWLYDYQPDYIVCHQPAWVFEAACPLLTESGTYAPTPGFTEDRYLLLFRTPGTTDEQIVAAVKAMRPR